MTLNAEGQPLTVDVLNGEVVMTGPRVAIAMEPSAAAETARRLVAAVNIAAEQDVMPARRCTQIKKTLGSRPSLGASNDS